MWEKRGPPPPPLLHNDAVFPVKPFLAVKDHDGGKKKKNVFISKIAVRWDGLEFHPVVSRSQITQVGQSAVKFRFFFLLHSDVVVGLWEV